MTSKDDTQRISKDVAKSKAEVFYNSLEVTNAILQENLKGNDSVTLYKSREWKECRHPAFIETLERLSECKVSVEQTIAYSDDIVVDESFEITFDWSDD